MAGWKPTPKADLFAIKRYERATGSWTECEFMDLKRGDIYTAFGRDGSQLDPLTAEAVEDGSAVCRCVADPERNEEWGQGYRVEVIVGPLEDHLSALSS